jgi:hypothetical protein
VKISNRGEHAEKSREAIWGSRGKHLDAAAEVDFRHRERNHLRREFPVEIRLRFE